MYKDFNRLLASKSNLSPKRVLDLADKKRQNKEMSLLYPNSSSGRTTMFMKVIHTIAEMIICEIRVIIILLE